MKANMVCIAALALAAGCASERQRYYVTEERPAVTVRTPDNHEVIIESDRTYVREYEMRRRENNMEPRYRGKHPDALGWNDPYWYRH